jgi:hypothetical protein
MTPLLSRFLQNNIRASLNKLALRNRGVGQKKISGPLGRGGADQGSGVALQSHVNDCKVNSVPSGSNGRKRKLDDDKTSEPKRINLGLEDFDKILDAFGEKLLDKVEEKINSISQSKKQVQNIPVVQNENQEEPLVDILVANTNQVELEKSLLL